MAEREGRRRSRRDGGRTFRALSSRGEEEDWIAELREEFPDHGPAGAVAPAPDDGTVLYDALADEEPAPTGVAAGAGVAGPAVVRAPDGTGPVGAAPSAADDPWQVFADVLDAQQSTLVALAERLDAVEARLDGVIRRVPPASDPRPPRPDAPTMREVVDALRASATASASRLGREVARRRPR